MVFGGEEGWGWRRGGGSDGEQSGYIMRPGSARLPPLTPFVRTDTVPITDVQSGAKLFLVLLRLFGLCWKRTFKVAPRGVGVGEAVLHM